MLSKLYRKLYLYSVAVIISSMVLTGTVMNVVFFKGEKRMVSEHIKKELLFAKGVIYDLYKDSPTKLDSKIKQINRTFNWDISVWEKNKCIVYTNRIPNIDDFTPQDVDEDIVLSERKKGFLVYFDEKNKDKGFFTIRFFHRKRQPNSVFNKQNPNDSSSMQQPPPPPEPRHFPGPLGGIISLFITTFFLAILIIPYTLYIVKPFKKLMISIENVSKGNFATLVEVPPNSEFRLIADAFNNMTNRIQEMINQKQRLIADVSHELRSPLTKIRLSLEIVSKEGIKKQKYIDKAIAEVENLDGLIDDLLLSSKFELDTKMDDFQDFEVVSFIKNIISKNQILFDEKGFKVNQKFEVKEHYLKGQKRYLEHAINNIFSNSIKYAQKDSYIDVNVSKKENSVIISIRDYGAGVKKEELDVIFEPFYRTDESRDRRTGGTGLGLSIVKKLISLHNGKVFAELPEDGKGGLIVKIIL